LRILLQKLVSAGENFAADTNLDLERGEGLVDARPPAAGDRDVIVLSWMGRIAPVFESHD
jgi:hypothetical protein